MYCSNNPLAYVDPTGKEQVDWLKLIIGIYVKAKTDPAPNELQKAIVNISEETMAYLLSKATVNAPEADGKKKAVEEMATAMEKFNNKQEECLSEVDETAEPSSNSSEPEPEVKEESGSSSDSRSDCMAPDQGNASSASSGLMELTNKLEEFNEKLVEFNKWLGVSD